MERWSKNPFTIMDSVVEATMLVGDGISLVKAVGNLIKGKNVLARGREMLSKALGLAKGKGGTRVAAYADDAARVGMKSGGKTGTVWDKIEVTQPSYAGTEIPRSFNINIDGNELWVNPNATKHMNEYLTRNNNNIGTFTTPISSQSMLYEFESALTDAINRNGIITDTMIHGGNWEFILSAPREISLNYVVKHARYIP